MKMKNGLPYFAQSTVQISRNALASGLCDEGSNRGLSALRLMNNQG
jgi:hypothetical protein